MKYFSLGLAVAIVLAATDASMGQRFRRSRGGATSGYAPGPRSEAEPAPSPQELQLAEIIRRQQHLRVGESTGEQDWQCFDWNDWRAFNEQNVPVAVVKQLGEDAEFKQLVEQIRQMDAAARNRLLVRASKVYKPTWAQLRQVSPAGQTEAGQLAEKRVAEAIVELVRQMISPPAR